MLPVLLRPRCRQVTVIDLGLGGLMAARVAAVGGSWGGLVRFCGAAGAGVVGAASAGAAEAGEICVAPWSAWW